MDSSASSKDRARGCMLVIEVRLLERMSKSFRVCMPASEEGAMLFSTELLIRRVVLFNKEVDFTGFKALCIKLQQR